MFFYRAISVIFFPILVIYIFLRALRGKENIARIKERFAFATKLRPQGELLWIHAVSVGEANSALILIHSLLEKDADLNILFTTTTKTSAEIIASKTANYNNKIIHQFLPLDCYFVVRKFLKFWLPKKIIFFESEIWPNFISESCKLGLSISLINARISEKSFLRWKFINKFTNIFDSFKIIIAQSLEDQIRFSNLTRKEVLFLGNLKSQAMNLSYSNKELEKLQKAINNRPFWLAASTHKKEEELVLKVHQELQKEIPNILTIIVPRHPNRSNEIQELIGNFVNPQNISVRSRDDEISIKTTIYLADTLGELGLFYRLSDLAFIGGSLFEIGGHNPYEAIKLNCLVLSGKHVFNFEEIYRQLNDKKACILVDGWIDLSKEILYILQNRSKANSYKENAKLLLADDVKIVEKIIERI